MTTFFLFTYLYDEGTNNADKKNDAIQFNSIMQPPFSLLESEMLKNYTKKKKH